MRPQILFSLFAGVQTLPGIGAKTAKLVERAAGPRLVDLLWHLPTGLLDRRHQPALASVQPGSVATLTLTVEQHVPGGGRSPYRVRCTDGTGSIDLVYFHGDAKWLWGLLPPGERRVVSGRVELYQDRLQMAHPDLVGPVEELAEIATVQPVYGLTEGLPPKTMARLVATAVERMPELPEWQDAAWLAGQGWPGWAEALRALHRPADAETLSPEHPARRRLAYDELLANQLALALIRRSLRRQAGRSIAGDGALRDRLLAALPFRLTGSQQVAAAEIAGDMASPRRMLRLLQGDVGSGKTVVAVLAMLTAVEARAQAVLLAPTEILARQHHATFGAWLAPLGLAPALVTGRERGAGRAATLAGLAEGRIAVAIGTHALLEEEVAFRDLALAVIDEQHRFGVHQRLQLSEKGRAADILVMTATPIPRTLQLTAYGDMDSSRLTDKPPGRQPIDTRAIPLDRLGEVVGAVARKLAEGGRIYWICPLVDQSEQTDLAAATERWGALRHRFGEQVGLLHGRMKGAEKDAAMADFAAGRTRILVATTVVEVGVDVPEATVIVIEHAERFGLAQLHQLRGRVGRGEGASTCLLLYTAPLTETARARIAALRATEDGFKLAEQDLALRGGGEMLGTRQSGLPQFRLADLAAHADLLPVARDDATLVLERDPDLAAPRGQALRTLLYLFERDAAVPLLRSG